MAWYDQSVFYHIYPLGLTGAPHENEPGGWENHPLSSTQREDTQESLKESVRRLRGLFPWITHIKEIGCNAIYIGPLFESVSHGYDTTDYYRLDSRLGTNEDLKAFVAECHTQEIRVILDGVFNHVGRDFFAFQDVKQNRENSRYTGWFCNLNFQNNNEYDDGFSYDNWGGHNQLVRLNLQNPEVSGYLCDVIWFWVAEFDIDGLRLDTADVLDFGFMQQLRVLANEVKPEFWLMGEVIHGEYIRWVHDGMLHSVTDYSLHKALYSGHNDHNYFEIAHTVKRIYNDMGLNRPGRPKLYDFVDNHDVERIVNKLNDRKQLIPVYILLYTLPGIPSLYYGSEFGIEGRKEYGSDWSLRPALQLSEYADAVETNELTRLIAQLGAFRQQSLLLCYGEYFELLLTNRQFAFGRRHEGQTVIAAVNNDENPAELSIPAEDGIWTGVLSGAQTAAEGGQLRCTIPGCGGEIWVRRTVVC